MRGDFEVADEVSVFQRKNKVPNLKLSSPTVYADCVILNAVFMIKL